MEDINTWDPATLIISLLGVIPISMQQQLHDPQKKALPHGYRWSLIPVRPVKRVYIYISIHKYIYIYIYDLTVRLRHLQQFDLQSQTNETPPSIQPGLQPANQFVQTVWSGRHAHNAHGSLYFSEHALVLLDVLHIKEALPGRISVAEAARKVCPGALISEATWMSPELDG